jgi:hypothetical protein
LVSATKDPVKVRAGQIGARVRWGEQPRVIRLDELTSDQRRLVVALVDAAKSAPAIGETPAGATSEVGHGHPDPTS